ncbi:MAG: hypothetical protein FJ255_07095 [Phycisphaerae bacterium]|nr:hypothetical protein [Phycisphaerae bacterium]
MPCVTRDARTAPSDHDTAIGVAPGNDGGISDDRRSARLNAYALQWRPVRASDALFPAHKATLVASGLATGASRSAADGRFPFAFADGSAAHAPSHSVRWGYASGAGRHTGAITDTGFPPLSTHDGIRGRDVTAR